jgi:energy-coupling factor transporter ATP-binding protein EcfA2
VPTWLLKTVEIGGGFLDGVRLELPSGLTCVIGPRGSGKSTFTEAIRYGIGGLSGASKPRADMIQANLGAAMITLRAAVAGSEEAIYTIRRTFRQPATLLAVDGSSVSSVDLDRGTFLPLDGFSSTEIEAIADESLGERRRALLDELRAEELRTVELRLADLRRALEANADRIKEARRLLGDITEQMEETGDARARLLALPKPSEDDVASRLTQATRQRMLNSRELQQVDAALARLDQLRQECTSLSEAHEDRPAASLLLPDSANRAIAEEGDRIVSAALSAAQDALGRAAVTLADGTTELHRVRDTFISAHQAQEAEHQRLHAENLAAGQIVQERAAAEEAVARLEVFEGRRREAAAELSRLRDQRRQIKRDFLVERDKVSSLRENAASELQNKAITNVQVRVLRHADDLLYQQTLIDALRGAGLRNHDDILQCLQRLRPEQLAQIVEEGDADELEIQTGLGLERCRKLITAFQAKLDPLALEVLPTDDRVCIELNVGTAAEPLFKDASDLSRGQKCTALLPLLLARRDIPLVIDQPEDNLDNHFIYETVVETIRQMKGQRQMIFITHNANIPVLGEADLVVVMNSDGRRGFVEKAGTLDECRDEIVNLLEGGRDAFERRRQRYARA